MFEVSSDGFRSDPALLHTISEHQLQQQHQLVLPTPRAEWGTMSTPSQTPCASAMLSARTAHRAAASCGTVYCSSSEAASPSPTLSTQYSQLRPSSSSRPLASGVVGDENDDEGAILRHSVGELGAPLSSYDDHGPVDSELLVAARNTDDGALFHSPSPQPPNSTSSLSPYQYHSVQHVVDRVESASLTATPPRGTLSHDGHHVALTPTTTTTTTTTATTSPPSGKQQLHATAAGGAAAGTASLAAAGATASVSTRVVIPPLATRQIKANSTLAVSGPSIASHQGRTKAVGSASTTAKPKLPSGGSISSGRSPAATAASPPSSSTSNGVPAPPATVRSLMSSSRTLRRSMTAPVSEAGSPTGSIGPRSVVPLDAFETSTFSSTKAAALSPKSNEPQPSSPSPLVHNDLIAAVSSSPISGATVGNGNNGSGGVPQVEPSTVLSSSSASSSAMVEALHAELTQSQDELQQLKDDLSAERSIVALLQQNVPDEQRMSRVVELQRNLSQLSMQLRIKNLEISRLQHEMQMRIEKAHIEASNAATTKLVALESKQRQLKAEADKWKQKYEAAEGQIAVEQENHRTTKVLLHMAEKEVQLARQSNESATKAVEDERRQLKDQAAAAKRHADELQSQLTQLQQQQQQQASLPLTSSSTTTTMLPPQSGGGKLTMGSTTATTSNSSRFQREDSLSNIGASSTTAATASRLRQQVQTLSALVEEKDAKIDQLNQQLTAAKGSIAAAEDLRRVLQNDATEHASKLRDLEREVRAAAHRESLLKEQLDESRERYEDELSRMTTNLSKWRSEQSEMASQSSARNRSMSLHNSAAVAAAPPSAPPTVCMSRMASSSFGIEDATGNAPAVMTGGGGLPPLTIINPLQTMTTVSQQQLQQQSLDTASLPSSHPPTPGRGQQQPPQLQQLQQQVATLQQEASDLKVQLQHAVVALRAAEDRVNVLDGSRRALLAEITFWQTRHETTLQYWSTQQQHRSTTRKLTKQPHGHGDSGGGATEDVDVIDYEDEEGEGEGERGGGADGQNDAASPSPETSVSHRGISESQLRQYHHGRGGSSSSSSKYDDVVAASPPPHRRALPDHHHHRAVPPPPPLPATSFERMQWELNVMQRILHDARASTAGQSGLVGDEDGTATHPYALPPLTARTELSSEAPTASSFAGGLPHQSTTAHLVTTATAVASTTTTDRDEVLLPSTDSPSTAIAAPNGSYTATPALTAVVGNPVVSFTAKLGHRITTWLSRVPPTSDEDRRKVAAVTTTVVAVIAGGATAASVVMLSRRP